MVRVLSALYVAFFLGQATGIWSALAEDACNERCPGDTPDGHCPPACQACACCSLPRTLAPEPTRVIPGVALQRAVSPPSEATPPSPDPGEIFHVPKLPA